MVARQGKVLARRELLKAMGAGIGVALLAACTPTTTVSPTTAPTAAGKVEEPTEQPPATAGPASPVKLNIWTTPGGGQLEFYEPIIKAFMEQNPNITVQYSPIPAGDSVQAVILPAVATGTAPDMWAEVERACAAQLVQEADLLVALDQMDGYQDLVKARQMDKLLPQVASPDGHNYFIPQFRNLEMYQWNVDMLASLGLEKPPRTYGEFLALAPKVVKEGQQWLITSFDVDPTWWVRIADWLPLFYAATGGRLCFDTDHADFNDADGLKVANFVQTIFKNKYAPIEKVNDPFETGRSLCHEFGTWRLAYQMEHYPNFKYVVTPPLVPDDMAADKNVITWGDNKGFVINKKNKHVEECWKLMTFLFGEVEHDVQFFETVGMLPCRQDLTSNPAFADLMAKRPAAKAYADYFDKIVDWEPQVKLIRLLDAFSKECWEPLVYNKKTAEQALADGAKAVDAVFNEA